MSNQMPVITIQCDWNEVVRLPKCEAWISSKLLNQNSVHDKLTTTLNEGKIKVNFSANYQFVSLSPLCLVVSHLESGVRVAFVAPSKAHKIHKKAILSVSLAENALAVSSCEEDKLLVWDSRTSEIILDLKGHGGPVYKCRYFPSGVVILSAGADGSCRIWSAESGINPVTLKGHTMAVTDICIVEKGRNVISVSKDGSAKLWDVGESKCLANIIVELGQINCCAITTTSNLIVVENDREPGDTTFVLNESSVARLLGAEVKHEFAARAVLCRAVRNGILYHAEPLLPWLGRHISNVGTGNKLLVAGCESGLVVGVHVANRELVFSKQLDSACNTITVVQQMVVVGCSNGKVILLNLPNGDIIREWYESASPVLSLVALPNQTFIVGRQDGTCTVLSLQDAFNRLRVQLTGSDCDGIRDLSFNGKWVFAGCRDAVVRKYDFNQINVHFK